jgi:cyclase
MTLAVRIIPCLDVANGRVVKGINFKNLVDQGDPVAMAKKYYEQGADEITFLDVSATVEGRSTMLDVVEKTAEQVFIPLTVGGGIRSVDDVAALLEHGADKVSVNSAAIARPELINEIVDRYGSQILVLSLDISRSASSPSGFVITTHGGRNVTQIDALSWVQEALDRGVGELLVNSIDADGTQEGFDVELIKRIHDLSSVPIIASGGAGDKDDFYPAVQAGADALLAASIFHNGTVSIADVKLSLSQESVEVR